MKGRRRVVPPLDPVDVECSAYHDPLWPQEDTEGPDPEQLAEQSTLAPAPRSTRYEAWEENDGGSWGGDYSATRFPQELRTWVEGWELVDRCPPDPRADSSPGRGGWRDVAALAGDRWRKVHNYRRVVVRELRRAGYVQRHRWPRMLLGTVKVGAHEVPDWRYLAEVPAVGGLPAVDAWAVARHLGRCSSSWYLQLRADPSAGLLLPLAVPRPCGLWHVCPVCAARRSAALAQALRGVISNDLKGRSLALVTLTQRDEPGEHLWEALGRWRRAWELVTQGRPGRRWAELVAGYYYGLEVTRGKEGKWWHVHAHAVLVLAEGVDHQEARAWVGQAWRNASESAGPGLGWTPNAGGCVLGERPGPVVVPLQLLEASTMRQLLDLARSLPAPPPGALSRMRQPELVGAILGAVRAWNRGGRLQPLAQPVTSWAGPWWGTVDPEDPRQVYQACKYPSPCARLKARHLAEFLAVAHGRRWHQGGGELRSVMRRAQELDHLGLVVYDPLQGEHQALGGGVVDVPPPLPIGRNVGSVAPGECPPLDEVADGLGWAGKPTHGQADNPEEPWASWRLVVPKGGEPAQELRELVRSRGGRVVQAQGSHRGEWWAWVPKAALRAELVERDRAARDRQEALARVKPPE